MTTSTPDAGPRSPGRLYLLMGLALAILGVIAYAVQIAMQRLTIPWYMPLASAVALIFLLVSLWKQRTVWRVLALLFVALLAGAEGAMLVAMRLPPYTGPVAVGQPFPAFETMRADGTPFTERDLQGDQNSVLVFFRGRW